MKKYTEISDYKWSQIKWRPNKMNVKYYPEILCECSHCQKEIEFRQFIIELEGTGMRLLVSCPNCFEKSVFKVKGIFKIRILTEGKASKRIVFNNCSICNKQTSNRGNLTNMLLTDIDNQIEFHKKYGMRCAKHAMDLTTEIYEKSDITKEDLRKVIIEAERSKALDVDSIL